jgi:hypothetical protein
VAALLPQDAKEPVMGLGKKAKREAKAVKGKTKKDARKVKHKGTWVPQLSSVLIGEFVG